jgi:hypothetical protein
MEALAHAYTFGMACHRLAAALTPDRDSIQQLNHERVFPSRGQRNAICWR